MGGTALGTGTGTAIEPLPDAAEFHLVIITPPVHISTAKAYKALNAPALTKDESAASLSVSRAAVDFAGSLQWEAVNDFEHAVLPAYPEIARARGRLEAAGAHPALLSGSGASVFGVFESAEAAGRAARSFEVEREGWRVFQSVTLRRAAYAQAFGRCARLLG
jgi:4-diphosphocytidyl-2-C-methyl-D-erythritol kinase